MAVGRGPVPVHIGAPLRAAADDLGEPARRWLSGLPDHLAEVADAWGLRIHDQLDHAGFCSVVYPVTTADGTDAMLKATVPHDEAAGEAATLQRWAGNGAARLCQASDDGFTLLLERCVPGHDLWTIPIDEQIDVVTQLLPRLWVEPDEHVVATDVGDALERWARRMRDDAAGFPHSVEVVRQAADWAEDLGRGLGRAVLLHGDVNPGNVLAATREPWLAIDPKPFVGERTFDLAQLALNWAWGHGDVQPDQPARVVRWMRRLAQALDLDADRALRWGLVKAIGWGSDPGDVRILHAAATSADRGR